MPVSSMTADDYLAPLASAWNEKVTLAKEAKKPFQAVADQCDKFFSSDHGFMWEKNFRARFLGGDVKPPQWRITIAKAFELVAIFGPTLFWKYPNRQVQNYKPLEIGPEHFGDPNDPAVQQIHQQIGAMEQRRQSENGLRNELMERYLNYSQREQPGGGLTRHSRLAATEGLVKGRGILWPRAYRFPGSSRTLTGCFYDSVENFLVDPDARDPALTDAKWICKIHSMPTWEAERLFGYRDGTLEGFGTSESAESVSTKLGDQERMERRHGKTFDLIEWYEIWSRGGVGTRMIGVYSDLHTAFEDVVGDYAYVCVTPNINHPLNAPPSRLAASGDEDVKRMFRWRCADYGPEFPAHIDGRWPCSVLDFYHRCVGRQNSAWPIAPLSPGLGELIAINALMSTMIGNGFAESQRIIAYMKSAAQAVEEKLKSGENPAFIEINDTIQKSVSDAISFIQHPPMNADIYQVIDRLLQMFDKRVGLTELVYGLNVGGVASRTAADIKAKQENLSIRPDDMATQVESWQSEAAQLEKFLAGWNVEGRDVQPLLGETGAYFWDRLITGSDPEIVAREMKATVEAGSVRKPNKQRDADNVNQTIQYLLPSLETHANATGDTQPLNAFLRIWGDTIDMDMSALQMGPRREQPTPEQQQMAQAQAQMEMQKQQAELLGKQLDAEIKRIELAIKQLELQIQQQTGGADVQGKQLEFQFDQARHAQDLQQDEQKHQQEMLQDRREFLQKMLQQVQEDRQKLESQQQLDQQKVAAAKSLARAKPKSNGVASGSAA